MPGQINQEAMKQKHGEVKMVHGRKRTANPILDTKFTQSLMPITAS